MVPVPPMDLWLLSAVRIGNVRAKVKFGSQLEDARSERFTATIRSHIDLQDSNTADAMVTMTYALSGNSLARAALPVVFAAM